MASEDIAMEIDEKAKARTDDMHERLEQGKAFHLANKPDQAEAAYNSVYAEEGDGEEFNKLKEQAICKLGELFANSKRVNDIQKLMISIRPFFANIPKAKTAKIVRTLIELVAKVDGSTELQLQLCLDTIEWCKQEKRTFLRHRIQAKLAAMYFETRDFTRAMALTEELLREVKKLDDKPLLVEIHLVESRIHHQVRNLPKSKAALTSARTAANAIYCPPALQAQIDTQSGVLHAEEKDYKTAYSYFFEAMEAFLTQENPLAVKSLKHMLLCKIMTNASDEVPGLIDNKASKVGSSTELESMRAIAEAYKERSLAKLILTMAKYPKELKEDPVTKFHLDTLYDKLLENNLSRLIEPFSQVQIVHIAKLIDLPITTVEATLSQMILDKKFNGILDQGSGALIAYEDLPDNTTLETGLEAIDQVGKVVDSLYLRAGKLS
mmetsp:Transcript_30689/g.44869  ORF Transcript_30689/g.44869 Transcript_30689/m.44869 type:complete len:437 (-) Transcript_30689:323-1633(-)